jgi:hypothetical protein
MADRVVARSGGGENQVEHVAFERAKVVRDTPDTRLLAVANTAESGETTPALRPTRYYPLVIPRHRNGVQVHPTS